MTRYGAGIPDDAHVRAYGSDAYLYSQIGPWHFADPESVKPVENPKPATDHESATGVTLQPVDSTGGVT